MLTQHAAVLCQQLPYQYSENEKWLIPLTDLIGLRGSTVSGTIYFGKSAYEASRQPHRSTRITFTHTHTFIAHKTHFSSDAQGRLQTVFKGLSLLKGAVMGLTAAELHLNVHLIHGEVDP